AQGKLYLIDTDQAAAVVGYIGGGKADAGALRVACERFGRDFASISAVSLDGRPLRASQRVLVTVVARAGNQGAQWNEARNSLGQHWGRGPAIAERVPATITLAGLGDRKVFALAPNGSRRSEVETDTTDDDRLTFAVHPAHQTLHYEIVPR
ncbi:MAG TPA: hypothetical protein VEQ65_05585, partial [Opitutus sp.]|nr:hypothetical protein [Opitutus sp.]